jgi:hypothetical protein
MDESVEELQMPPELRAAIVRNAERQAEATAVFLRAIDLRLRQDGHRDGARGFPSSFLLELGALCQLVYWEQQGLRAMLPASVPRYAEAVADLQRRVASEPGQLYASTGAALSRQLLHVYATHFHWLAPDLIDAEIVIDQLDEDEVIESLAKLLWSQRNASQN